MGTLNLGEESSSPGTPASGLLAVYAKTDGNLYYKNDAGTEVALGNPGLVLIESKTASASSSIDFTTGIGSTYSVYELHISSLVPATDNTDLWIRITTDGGSTWKAGASDYGWTRTIVADGTPADAGDIADAQSVMALGLGTGTGENLNAVIKFFDPASTTLYKGHMSDFAYLSATPNRVRGIHMGLYQGDNTTAINGFRILMSSGNIASGIFTLYGDRKA